ncbi:methionyl-tRNA formyltransferase [Collinsella sp. An307]|uniref:methionyl-tRNA formyltransferase n=1 Tax=Collinsella sp. An307 TaxID=1965630 RepID=UPI000B38F955|nr:methionyl-tRNA formyltransferase [Collinsella sp. An307]OUO18867.1 methionyl-tRNA formyltransferase [Collinsella sp. An307]
MRVVFMGTPAFAVPSLTALAREHEVALVVTRPDAVRSRGKKLEPSAVKAAALELGLPVLETSRMTPEVLDALRAAGADIFCVAAYGCILPDEVLHMAPLGCVNVHASLLPRWRGAAPIQRSILAGDDETGVSIMRIGQGVDTGDYCAQASCSVPGKTADELTAELAELGGELLVRTLPAIADGTATWTVQDESLVTHAAKIAKAELRLDPAASASQNVRRVLASSDAAPARCSVASRQVRILSARAPEGADASSLGGLPKEGVFAIRAKRVLLGCADGAFEVLEVKPDGKRAMDAAAWAAGLQTKEGAWELLS